MNRKNTAAPSIFIARVSAQKCLRTQPVLASKPLL